jgi:hypothetical protein
LGAATSTIGGLMILSSFLQTDTNSTESDRASTLTIGASLIALSYLASKTIQIANEELLQRAVNEYNKRNVPRIFFTPYQDGDSSGIGVGFQQEF